MTYVSNDRLVIFVPERSLFQLVAILSLSKAVVNVARLFARLFQIAETVLQESGGGDRGGFGAEDATAKRYDLHSGGASFPEFFV